MDGVAYLDKKTKTKITFNELKLLEISKMNELMIDGCGRTSKKQEFTPKLVHSFIGDTPSIINLPIQPFVKACHIQGTHNFHQKGSRTFHLLRSIN